MRQGRPQRRGFVRAWLAAAGLLCAWCGGASAQPTAATTATGNPWATGGVPGSAAGTAAMPYWQAPALPAAVIQGGTIPPGWSPQPVPYQGMGPDGRPLTMYYSPTYVFTYPIGPPAIAAGAAPTASPPWQVNRRQARPQAAPPATMQGWNYQAQPAAPLPPATVARYAPAPYQFPPGARSLTGTPIVPPSAPLPAAAATAPPSAVPVGPPTQWTPSSEPPPAGLAPSAAPPMAPLQNSAVPPAAAPPPAAFVPASPPQTVPAQPVSVAPRTTSSRSGSQHVWRVVGVHDGDTITCLDESNQQQKVRLAEIDAPEIGQDYGKVSREVLAEMVFGKTIDVTEEGKDRYGRWIGHINSGGVDVNRQMVATGNAWHYEDYSRDTSLAALQAQARGQRLGLWAQPDPVAPWDFRKSGQK